MKISVAGYVRPVVAPAVPPSLTPGHVKRPSVDALLDCSTKSRICVVIGAAGWGKTTAVASWSASRPTAWVAYEDHEGDANLLLGRLVAVLRDYAVVPAREVTLTAGTGDVMSATAAVCRWVRRGLRKDVVLVLDDVHGLRSHSDAMHMLENLCRHVPDQLRLVLISRRELPISLQRLRGRGLVKEIHAPDLAFDIADIEALLRQTVGRDPPGLSRHVWEHTGGWATAVHAAVEMVRAVRTDQRLDALQRLSHQGQRFHQYITEEVIGAAPGWVQQLLRELAISGACTTEMACAADATTTALAELSRQGLVRRSSGDSAAWSLVPPLQHYFEQEVAPSSAERAALHVTAARQCIGRGAPAEALRHLMAAGDHAACAALLVDHGDALVESGQLEGVLQAAELPAEYLADPRIQGVLGLAQQVRGHWAQAQQYFERASHDRDELEPALAWRLGLIAFARGEFDEVQALTLRARLDCEDTVDEARVLALSASAYRMTGDLVGLRKMATQAQAAAQRCGQPRAWSNVHHVMAMLAAAEGDWRQADARCTDAQRSAEATDDLCQLTWTRLCRAFHQLEAGAPRHALADAQIALILSERCENPFFVAHALTTRGRARRRLGSLDEALGDFATAIDLFQRLGSRFLAWPLAGLGDLYRTRGQLVRARAVYEEALDLAEPYHDVFGLNSALIGLAGISAADDLPPARELATRAVELGERLREIPSLLARGWVELMGGDLEGACADGARAAVAARRRRDNLGLAEATTLGVLASSDPAADAPRLREAIDIWHETGCGPEEAATRLVAARLGAPIAHLDADNADQTLRNYHIDIESRRVAGPIGVLVRVAPAVSIRALGVFTVLREGVPIPNGAWKSKKARDLLKILVARRRPAPRDVLMELLWPETNPTVAGNRLSVLLCTVRDVLAPHPVGEGPLVTTGAAVSLSRAQVRVDVDDFLARATAALEADRAGEPAAISQLEAAVAAHTGDFLEDDPYQDWAAALDEEVRATHIALLRALADRKRDAGDTDAAVRYMLRLLEQDSYDEEAHLTLLGVLLDAGRLGHAHRHHRNYARRMAEIAVRPRPLAEMMLSRVSSPR